jgi:SAM-dependent methyltransferase
MKQPSEPARLAVHGPDIAFWQQRFETCETPWDRGDVNPQLQKWLAEGAIDAHAGAIAVPGCGSGHEVAALAAADCDVLAIDYTPAAVALTQQRLAARHLRAELVQADVLAWLPTAPLAAVYEQTCLCALHPDHWTAYAAQLHAWLRPGGRLFALFMQAPRDGGRDGFIEGPPYHCHIHAMRALFPAPLWDWPRPPYPQVQHARGIGELAVLLTRR